MIQIIPSHSRYAVNLGWLKTRWLFSFSDYYDPQNLHFGTLRVFNDNTFDSGTGFPMHPHREMETITIVLRGELTHRDSLGNEGTLRDGDIECMSAGTGIEHAELNLSGDPVRMFQIWIFPDTPGMQPSYRRGSFEPGQWRNTLLPIASGQGHDGAVSIRSDSTIYRTMLDPGAEVEYTARPDRRVFIYVRKGQMTINGTHVQGGDQARISHEQHLTMVSTSQNPMEFFLIDVPCRDGRH